MILLYLHIWIYCSVTLVKTMDFSLQLGMDPRFRDDDD